MSEENDTREIAYGEVILWIVLLLNATLVLYINWNNAYGNLLPCTKYVTYKGLGNTALIYPIVPSVFCVAILFWRGLTSILDFYGVLHLECGKYKKMPFSGLGIWVALLVSAASVLYLNWLNAYGVPIPCLQHSRGEFDEASLVWAMPPSLLIFLISLWKMSVLLYRRAAN